MAETTQESKRAMEITGKSELANSEALELEKAIGMNPAHVISVPVKSGQAQVAKA